MMRYQGCSIAMQEVPDEISLVLLIGNCQHRCAGCHSPELREDSGQSLARDILGLLTRYRKIISCVCFMGEGGDVKALKRHLLIVRAFGLKTCLYSGCDEVRPLTSLLPHLDYLKLGSYIESRGGLDSPSTNQRFYAIKKGRLDDITYSFQRKRMQHDTSSHKGSL